MSIKSFLSLYFARIIVQKNLVWKNNAVKTQNNLLKNLLKTAKDSTFGLDHDFTEIKNVVSVEVKQETNLFPKILFDPEHNLEERILKEQFLS